MTLVDSLREALSDPGAGSFQLMGEDFFVLPPSRLRDAAEAYRRQLEARVPKALRADFESEQETLSRVYRSWLNRYNTSLHRRVKGYLALGRLIDFEYPWPVAAILGIYQVATGFRRMGLYNLVGQAGSRLGFPTLLRVADGIADALRRTNRGIFADSVPTTLLALRCHDLRAQGRVRLATALLDGPLPPLMDDHSRRLAQRLYESLSVSDGGRRFRLLADLTLEHFRREQAIFTHHLGGHRRRSPGRRPRSRLASWLARPRSVPAPVIERDERQATLRFRPFALPRGFDMRDHESRVRYFAAAFVSSVTGSLEDYAVAVRWVIERFGDRGERVQLSYPDGGTPPTMSTDW